MADMTSGRSTVGHLVGPSYPVASQPPWMLAFSNSGFVTHRLPGENCTVEGRASLFPRSSFEGTQNTYRGTVASPQSHSQVRAELALELSGLARSNRAGLDSVGMFLSARFTAS